APEHAAYDGIAQLVGNGACEGIHRGLSRSLARGAPPWLGSPFGALGAEHVFGALVRRQPIFLLDPRPLFRQLPVPRATLQDFKRGFTVDDAVIKPTD